MEPMTVIKKSLPEIFREASLCRRGFPAASRTSERQADSWPASQPRMARLRVRPQ